MDWSDLINRVPKDAEAERRLLGAVLVSDDDATPDEELTHLSIVFGALIDADFGDPFHAWLFKLIGEARAARPTLDKQLAFILSRINKREARRRFAVENLAWEIAKLLVTREGDPCCGRVASIRRYGNHLREVREYREHVQTALEEVRRAYDEWDRAQRDGLATPH